MLRFLDRPALVELDNFHKNRCEIPPEAGLSTSIFRIRGEIPLLSGALEPDLRL
jgi:hypothetical protein